MKKALITGVTGQDGSYLSDFLLEQGYEVHGMLRRASVDTTQRLFAVKRNPNFQLHYGDLADSGSLKSLIKEVEPDEVYNLGAQSDVHLSFGIPEQTGDITGLGVLRLLEAIVASKKPIRFYQASSSEMFGKVHETPQKETTPFYPRSPYGVAKLYGYWITRNYREAYKLFACNGILFNHESPERGENFVTKKIVKHLVEVFMRKREYLEIGNLDSKRDWGFAGDYVKAMWLMLQADAPDDYVVATGETHSVREFIERTQEVLEVPFAWIKKDKPTDEVGINTKTGKVVVRINPDFYRPTEVDILVGDYSKIRRELGWTPQIMFKELVTLMVGSEF